MTVLAASARLAHELAFRLDGAADRLAVSHLRRADVRLHVEFALHAIDDDLEVQLTHTGDDRLPGFRIRVHAERRVLFREPLQGETHLFLVNLGARLDGYGNDRYRENHLLERDDLF